MIILVLFAIILISVIFLAKGIEKAVENDAWNNHDDDDFLKPYYKDEAHKEL